MAFKDDFGLWVFRPDFEATSEGPGRDIATEMSFSFTAQLFSGEVWAGRHCAWELGVNWDLFWILWFGRSVFSFCWRTFGVECSAQLLRTGPVLAWIKNGVVFLLLWATDLCMLTNSKLKKYLGHSVQPTQTFLEIKQKYIDKINRQPTI